MKPTPQDLELAAHVVRDTESIAALLAAVREATTESCAKQVKAWVIAILEEERDKLLRIIAPSGELVPPTGKERFLDALMSVMSLITKVRDYTP